VPICGTPSSIWKKAVAESNPGTFASLSDPDAGKLKSFVKTCAEGGLPDHAGNVIEHVARNWLEFTSEAEKKASAWKTPLQPDPGFLLKYVQVAVNFWLDGHQLHLVGGTLQTVQPETPESKPASGMNVPKKPKPVTPPVDDDDKPMTQEEFMAIIGSDFLKPKK